MTVYEIKPCNSRGSVGYETFDPKKPVKTDFPLFPRGIFETTESIQLLLI